MPLPVRPLAAAALAIPLLTNAAPAGAGPLTDSQVSEVAFTSSETGDEVSCWFSAYTSVEDPEWPYTSTESSGDFAECYAHVRVETRATWTDSSGRTVRVSRTDNFIDVIRLEDVASDLVVRHEVTYGQCDRHDQCHYESETSAK